MGASNNQNFLVSVAHHHLLVHNHWKRSSIGVMVDEKKIVLLTDFIEQKVRKEKELEFYTSQLEELQKKMFFLRKEIQLTNYIIEIVENEKVIDIREYLEDKRDRDS